MSEGMPRKDYQPIKFEFFQSEMEKILYTLRMIQQQADSPQFIEPAEKYELKKILDDLQHKVICHINRGEWI